MLLALWLSGLLAAGLYLKVGWFSFRTLKPSLGCWPSPEMRFWGYSDDVFATCFAQVPEGVLLAYRDVLTGVDRALAVALGVLLILLAMRYRAWFGAVAAAIYVVADWRENATLVELLDGSGDVESASTWTIAKFLLLGTAVLSCWRTTRWERTMP